MWELNRLMYLRGNSIGMHNDDNDNDRRQTTHLKSFLLYDNKMCSGTTDFDRLSATHSYTYHGTRMTLSSMFYVLCASS